MKDLIQQKVLVNVASPLNTYRYMITWISARSKGFSFTLDRRTNNIELTQLIHLQFADGSSN